MGISTFGLVCLDQHRLQTWAWQFVILSVVVAVADAITIQSCWRWLVISIYAWSAWSKFDEGFFVNHGLFLLDGIFKAIGFHKVTIFWSDSFVWKVTAAIPSFELLIALGLAWQRTRKLALAGSTIMHLGLLLALGPLGHGHKPGVLCWNLFFLAQNWMLFRQSPLASAASVCLESRSGNLTARLAVTAAIVWPAFAPFGYCDHWPAWAVYAARLERVTVLIPAEEQGKLSPEVRQHLGPQTLMGEWHPLRIDRWSLEILFAPIYPQDRFQIGVAIGLAKRFDLKQIRVEIEGPGLSGRKARPVQVFVGLESLNELANTFRCNAQPRLERFASSNIQNSEFSQIVNHALLIAEVPENRSREYPE